uniref:LRP chaperone MESD n=1 Tax=Oryctolagus cuniculus TaxID=9986 RepID=A0A5F9D005_RABIT
MAASSWARKAVVLLCASDLLLLLLLLPPPRASAAEGPAGTPGEASAPPRKKKKDIRDYNDADMARLLEQWEKDDDIEEGDLPEHKRPSAPVDFSKIDPGKPESILKMTKKGKTLMMFVTVSGSPTEKETEEITSLWQGSLFNANYDVQRFIVGSDRAIFMLRDGGYAWEIKDFLVSQDRCADVTLEGQAGGPKVSGGCATSKFSAMPKLRGLRIVSKLKFHQQGSPLDAEPALGIRKGNFWLYGQVSSTQSGCPAKAGFLVGGGLCLHLGGKS